MSLKSASVRGTTENQPDDGKNTKTGPRVPYPQNPQMTQVNQPTHVNQPTPLILQGPLALGNRPMRMTCPYCNFQIVTITRMHPSTLTHLLAVLICICGGWVCCCCFCPYCFESCQNVVHYCPNCQNYLGKFEN
uniref:LITAF domain-containing protein n=1 Tax=Lygus hesperus TaxID=30085 RepID=A0A0A9WXW7_LYGHE